jgi:beta-N-acetylhexosaminidase
MVAHGENNHLAVIEVLQSGLQSGKITEQMVNESVYRILKLKEKYHLDHEEIQLVDIDKINEEMEEVLKAEFSVD